MANRVCFGQKGSEIGLFISKPGINVLTATVDQMLLSTTYRALQVVQVGTFHLGTGSEDVTIPNLGYSPKVIAFMHVTGTATSNDAYYLVLVEYPNLTTIRLTNRTVRVPTDGNVSYLVIREPVNG